MIKSRQTQLFFIFIYVIYLFLTVLGLHCCTGLSLIAAIGGCSLIAVHKPLLQWLLLLWSTGSRAQA